MIRKYKIVIKKKEEQKECVVCYETVNYTNDCSLTCNHNLCFGCLTRLTQTLCPYCRRSLSSSIENIESYLKIIKSRHEHPVPVNPVPVNPVPYYPFRNLPESHLFINDNPSRRSPDIDYNQFNYITRSIRTLDDDTIGYI